MFRFALPLVSLYMYCNYYLKLLFTVGVLYGTTSVAVGHPLDTIKTKMQAQHGFEKNGMWQTFIKTLRTQGVIGLYRYEKK